MFKTILAFIKAHTIATAITTTVVVSTAVATPIIINQAQKPEQEIETGQVQENIIDNTVIDNTVEEETETPEENIVEENTTVPEEEQKVETSKEENKQDQNKNQGTTKPTTNNKTETPTQPSTPTQPTQKKIVSFNDRAKITYNETDKTISFNYGPGYKDIPKDSFLAYYYNDVKKYQEPIETSIYWDQYYDGIYNKDYCQKKVAEYTSEINRIKKALEYFKVHKDEIQLDANNNWKYEGYTYNNYIPDFETDIAIAERNRNEWQQKLNNAPKYRSSRERS